MLFCGSVANYCTVTTIPPASRVCFFKHVVLAGYRYYAVSSGAVDLHSVSPGESHQLKKYMVKCI
jgi:hypothetical protein